MSWLAVRTEIKGAGVGCRLVEAVAERLSADGVELLTVKTLAAIVESEHYAHIRKFYEERGFRHIERIDLYPEWEPGNTCAVYVKPLDRC